VVHNLIVGRRSALFAGLLTSLAVPGVAKANVSSSGSFVVGAQPDFNVDPTGVSDSTAGLQAFLNASANNIGYLPPGNYRTSARLLVSSNTVWFGAGFATQIFTTSAVAYNFVNNRNFQEDAPVGTPDQDITISNLYFNYGSLDGGGAHAVSFGFVINCVVERCYFSGGNDGTAMLATKNCTVRDCWATGCTNVAFDSWSGIENLLVENCTAYMAPARGTGTNAGIMFSASSTAANVVCVARGCIARGNRIYGAGVAVFSNVLDTLSANDLCIMEDNAAYNCFAGFHVTGVGYGHRVINNSIMGGGGGAGTNALAIRLAGDTGGSPPTDCIVRDNVISGFTGDPAAVGLINIAGQRHTLGDMNLIGCSIANGSAYWVKTPGFTNSVITGIQSADAASIAGIPLGLFRGSTPSINDTNAMVDCFDGFLGKKRFQGPVSP
jgi:pectate lyase-like protein